MLHCNKTLLMLLLQFDSNQTNRFESIFCRESNRIEIILANRNSLVCTALISDNRCSIFNDMGVVGGVVIICCEIFVVFLYA